jgi:hypothetical protein
MIAAVIQAPADVIESAASLRFPPKADELLQGLMDQNNEGTLTPQEREELAALVELSENMALLRAKALDVLGRGPQRSGVKRCGLYKPALAGGANTVGCTTRFRGRRSTLNHDAQNRDNSELFSSEPVRSLVSLWSSEKFRVVPFLGVQKFRVVPFSGVKRMYGLWRTLLTIWRAA